MEISLFLLLIGLKNLIYIYINNNNHTNIRNSKFDLFVRAVDNLIHDNNNNEDNNNSSSDSNDRPIIPVASIARAYPRTFSPSSILSYAIPSKNLLILFKKMVSLLSLLGDREYTRLPSISLDANDNNSENIVLNAVVFQNQV